MTEDFFIKEQTKIYRVPWPALRIFTVQKGNSPPILWVKKSTAPAFCGKSLYPFFIWKKIVVPFFHWRKKPCLPFILRQKMSMPHFFTGQISLSPPCSYTWPGLVPQL